MRIQLWLALTTVVGGLGCKEKPADPLAEAELKARQAPLLARGDTSALADLALAQCRWPRRDRILQVISEMVAETFDSPVCSIMIVDEDKQELSIRAARCSSPSRIATSRCRATATSTPTSSGSEPGPPAATSGRSSTAAPGSSSPAAIMG